MDDALPHRRPSLRLPAYDYTQPGGYFITLCTHNRRCLFGTVDQGKIHLNPAGQMVQDVWSSLPERFAHIRLDVMVVMPNHLHGIVLIDEHRPAQGLGQIVGAFKSLTTNRYIAGVRQCGWTAFASRLWQDNYFEHVIRSEEALDRIRRYIEGNPGQWEDDPERPEKGI